MFAAFCEDFAAQLGRREHLASMAGARRELASDERRLTEILRALREGYRSEAWKAELASVDSRKAELNGASGRAASARAPSTDGRGVPPEGYCAGAGT